MLREVHAACCPHCRGDLAAAAQTPCAVYGHIELPPIRPEVTRVTMLGGRCPHCARRFMTVPPADMPPGSPFGANLRALALALHLRFSQGIGLDRLKGVFRDVFGLKISEGALVNMLHASAAPFAAHAVRLRDRLRAGATLASDETGLRVTGKTFWLWVMHHGESAAFRAEPSRAEPSGCWRSSSAITGPTSGPTSGSRAATAGRSASPPAATNSASRT